VGTFKGLAQNCWYVVGDGIFFLLFYGAVSFGVRKVERRLGCRTSRFLISFPACKEWKKYGYSIHFSFFETSVELKIQAFLDVRCIG
jgi:hypothetical protein